MNKLRYNVSFWLGALFLFVTGGCLDYFDVRPKSQVLADELFSTEEGFSDQLTGVYKRLASTSLYGQEMTFGLAEALHKIMIWQQEASIMRQAFTIMRIRR